jgi:hypothetical protein
MRDKIQVQFYRTVAADAWAALRGGGAMPCAWATVDGQAVAAPLIHECPEPLFKGPGSNILWKVLASEAPPGSNVIRSQVVEPTGLAAAVDAARAARLPSDGAIAAMLQPSLLDGEHLLPCKNNHSAAAPAGGSVWRALWGAPAPAPAARAGPPSCGGTRQPVVVLYGQLRTEALGLWWGVR